MKLKKSPIEPATKNALSIVSSSFGRQGKQAHPAAAPEGQHILLTASHDGWSSAIVELKPQQLKVV